VIAVFEIEQIQQRQQRESLTQFVTRRPEGLAAGFRGLPRGGPHEPRLADAGFALDQDQPPTSIDRVPDMLAELSHLVVPSDQADRWPVGWSRLSRWSMDSGDAVGVGISDRRSLYLLRIEGRLAKILAGCVQRSGDRHDRVTTRPATSVEDVANVARHVSGAFGDLSQRQRPAGFRIDAGRRLQPGK
jgi:hypothetical protein